MTKRHSFRVFVGPTAVGEVTERFRAAGIDAAAGTEHVYGELLADNETAAEAMLNAAARYAVVDRRHGRTWCTRIYEPVEILAGYAVKGDPCVSVFLSKAMNGTTSIIATEGETPNLTRWSGSEEAWATAQREARERLGIPEPAPAKAPKRRRARA